MTKPRKRAVRRLMIDALALAETFDHETAPRCHDLIEAMDRAEGDVDLEPSLGWSADVSGIQIEHDKTDREHDPAELGELTESGFANEAPWETYTGILGGGLWNWRGERV